LTGAGRVGTAAGKEAHREEIPTLVRSRLTVGRTFAGKWGRIPVDRGVLKCEPTSRRSFFEVVRTKVDHWPVTACHLGNTAMGAGSAIDWDLVPERITDDPALNDWLIYEYRAPGRGLSVSARAECAHARRGDEPARRRRHD